MSVVSTCSKGKTVGSGRETGEEVDATHVVGYVVHDRINSDQPPSKCR